MPQVINTNMSSLIGQRNLDSSRIDLQRSLERLSSGLRVNSAADDAAGLAIAATMSRQISGYEVALRNANDADSYLQVAEGGLEIVQDMVIRMKELALQAANGSNSANERANLDTEYQQLLAEIDRVVNSTNFNGEAILTGDTTNANAPTQRAINFQVGIDGNNHNLNVTLHQANASNLGIDADGDFVAGVSEISGAFGNTDALENVITFSVTENGVEHRVNVNLDTDNDDNTNETLDNFVAAFNNAMSMQGLGLTLAIAAGNDLQLTNSSGNTVTVSAASSLSFAGETNPVDFRGGVTLEAGNFHLINDVATDNTSGLSAAPVNIVVSLDGVAQTPITAAASVNDLVIALDTAVGNDITVVLDADGNITFTRANGNTQAITITTDNDLIYGGVLMLSSDSPVAIGGGNLVGTSVTTVANAQTAMDILDGAVTMISTQRAIIGASQNRLSETIKNTSTAILNLTLSRARIVDADFAKETSEMTRNQILQQAGISILAQANQLPQNVLRLLQ